MLVLGHSLPPLSTVFRNFSQASWGGVYETSSQLSQPAGVLMGACPVVHQELGALLGLMGRLMSPLSLKWLLG